MHGVTREKDYLTGLMVFHYLQQHIASLFSKIRPFSIRYVALVTTISLLASFVHVRAQQPADTLAGERTKFIGKISHWLAAYGASGEDFMREKRNAFKSAAFAEVYVEGIIDHPAWMFTMLNRVTQAKYAEKQTPYILFGIKFKPQDDNLDSYEISLTLQEGSAIAPQRDDGIVSNASAKHLGGKTYAEPVAAEADLEKAIGEALDGLQAKLGNSLAPKLMVRYQDEVFWNGHEIPILDAEGNSVELEAIDRDGALLSPDEITWTNADPFQSRGVVDMTGTQTKAVTLSWGNDPMTVTLKRVSVSQDINELLKALIIEALSAKKQEAVDTLAVLKLDSAANATEIQRYLAGIDAGNFPLEGNGNLAPMFETPIVRPDSTALFQNNDIGPNLLALKQRKKVRSAIRRKVNVVALADLIVDHPDRVTILLDELLRSSGQLVARIILNRDSQGQRTELRNIVLDFLNKNLERVAGNHYPSSLSQEPPLVIPPVTVQQPTFDPQKFLYVNPRMSFPGKDQLIQRLTADVPAATYVFINYSQDVNLTSYQARAKGTRPMGLPEGANYRVFTVLHMPGSLLEVHLASAGMSRSGATDDQEVARILEEVRCACIKNSDVRFLANLGSAAEVWSVDDFRLLNGQVLGELQVFTRNRLGLPLQSDYITFDPKQQIQIKENSQLGPDWILEYAERETGVVRFVSDNKSDLEKLLMYFNASETEVLNELQPKLAEFEQEVAAENPDIEKLKSLVFSIRCGFERLRSADARFFLLKAIADEIFVDAFDETVVIDVLRTTTDRLQASNLLSRLKDDDTGILEKFDGLTGMNDEEYDEYYQELTKLFYRAYGSIESLEQEFYDKIRTYEAAALDNDFRTIEEMARKRILIWSNPGLIKFIGQTDFSYVDYEDISIKNSLLSFSVDHVRWFGSDYDFTLNEFEPFEPIAVFFITSSGELFSPGSGRSSTLRGEFLLMPAVGLFPLNSLENQATFNRTINAASFVIPMGLGVRASRWGWIALETVLFATQAVMDDYAEELRLTPEGQLVLRSWMVVSILYSVADMSGGLDDLRKAIVNFRSRVAKLPAGPKKSTLEGKVDEIEDAIGGSADGLAKGGANRFFKSIDEFKAAIARGDNVFYIGKHADITPRPIGVQSHHGVNSVWMENNYSNYVPDNAPSVYMLNDPNHNATRGVFNTWRAEMSAVQGTSKVDYSKITKADILKLAERQFDAADVPKIVRDEYYKLWEDYLNTMTKKVK